MKKKNQGSTRIEKKNKSTADEIEEKKIERENWQFRTVEICYWCGFGVSRQFIIKIQPNQAVEQNECYREIESERQNGC